MTVGGSIESIEINARTFAVAADAEVNGKLGGFETEVQMNGDGSARMVKTRVGWSLDGANIHINPFRGDQEFLQDIADGTEFVPIVITYASGATYQGTGIVTGEIQASSQSATAAISLMGPGKLTRQ